MRSRPIGSIIGAIGGLIFVLVNAGGVPAALVWRIVAVVAFVAIIVFVVLRGPTVEQEPPSRAALRTYGIAVTAMIVAIVVGSLLLNKVLDRPYAVVVWVVFAVGAHFLPFAGAFRLPVFRWLAVSLMLVAVVGAIPTFAGDSATAARWTGVAAGFVLLFFAAIGPRLSRPAPAARLKPAH